MPTITRKTVIINGVIIVVTIVTSISYYELARSVHYGYVSMSPARDSPGPFLPVPLTPSP